ncbi:MAG: metallophosphoesterase, partial [Planctomycetota bacterium]|nr:metallophosphoesterase [Planctomycetota bacterium]
QDSIELAIPTGDRAHDESPQTYDAIQQSLDHDRHRCLFLPGNHDCVPHVRSMVSRVADFVLSQAKPLSDSRTSDSRIETPPFVFQPPMDSTAAFQRKLHGWNLIGLDTQLPGEVSGRIGDRQMRWLAEVLGDPSPTLIFMHHPPQDIGVDWLDDIGLRNQREFQQLILKHSHVRGIFCGHVHQEFEGRIGGTRVFTTPSTAMQFCPTVVETRFDLLPPGFRWIDVDSDDFSTGVIRLESLEFPPELEG